MERTIVTVGREGETGLYDLELALDLPAEQLAGVVARALGWSSDVSGSPMTFEIVLSHSGRPMAADETLADVQAWDGSMLIFRPSQRTMTPLTPVDVAQDRDWPSVGFRPLTDYPGQPRGGH